MRRRAFLAMGIPALASACVGWGGGPATVSPSEAGGPEQPEMVVGRSTDFDGGENLREFMKRARDRRVKAAKRRRERREKRARARRRGRNRSG